MLGSRVLLPIMLLAICTYNLRIIVIITCGFQPTSIVTMVMKVLH